MDTAQPTPQDEIIPPKEPLDQFWEVVKRMPRYLRLATALIRDERVPAHAKAALAVGGAYTISPIDAIPGFIPIAGQLDDLLILLVAIREALVFSPPAVAKEHLARFNLENPGIDADIKATLVAAQWVAMKVIRAVGRISVREGNRLFQLSKRAAIAVEDRWHSSQGIDASGPN
jgi:uncharacterized membrane protein YkvA (DUF1232 family)